MAGGDIAETNNVSAFGVKGQVKIESGHIVALCSRDAQAVVDKGENIFRQVAVFFLHGLEHGNQSLGVSAIFIKNRANFVKTTSGRLARRPLLNPLL